MPTLSESNPVHVSWTMGWNQCPHGNSRVQFPNRDFTRLLQPHCRIAPDPGNFRCRIQYLQNKTSKRMKKTLVKY